MGLQLALPFVPEMPTTVPTPFLKWVGGKWRLLSQLTPLLPPGAEAMRHVEAFLGGGALFFSRHPQCALLSDKNQHLCTTYEVVRYDVEAVIDQLGALSALHNEARYYELRHRYNHAIKLSPVERAALFIYLNKTCFNGLYRVNRRGEFNVPIGRYEAPRILDEAALRAASRRLQGVDLRCAGFEVVLEHAREGDFVYLDPPYVPVSRTARFTAYGRDGFTLADQARLRDVFVELDRRGCAVMMSNSAVAEIRALYRGYVVSEVCARRSVGCNIQARQPVQELVVRNYGAASQPRFADVPARDVRASTQAELLEACA
jgi:DNA adenine methylase